MIIIININININMNINITNNTNNINIIINTNNTTIITISSIFIMLLDDVPEALAARLRHAREAAPVGSHYGGLQWDGGAVDWGCIIQ